LFIATGKKDVVRLLLENGACVGLENAIHKTATQMAAFIGK
jgi:ankyrin repeat protein